MKSTPPFRHALKPRSILSKVQPTCQTNSIPAKVKLAIAICVARRRLLIRRKLDKAALYSELPYAESPTNSHSASQCSAINSQLSSSSRNSSLGSQQFRQESRTTCLVPDDVPCRVTRSNSNSKNAELSSAENHAEIGSSRVPAELPPSASIAPNQYQSIEVPVPRITRSTSKREAISTTRGTSRKEQYLDVTPPPAKRHTGSSISITPRITRSPSNRGPDDAVTGSQKEGEASVSVKQSDEQITRLSSKVTTDSSADEKPQLFSDSSILSKKEPDVFPVLFTPVKPADLIPATIRRVSSRGGRRKVLETPSSPSLIKKGHGADLVTPTSRDYPVPVATTPVAAKVQIDATEGGSPTCGNADKEGVERATQLESLRPTTLASVDDKVTKVPETRKGEAPLMMGSPPRVVERRLPIPKTPAAIRKERKAQITELNETVMNKTLNESMMTLRDVDMSIAACVRITGKAAAKTREFWTERLADQAKWLARLRDGTFARPSVVCHVMQCWQLLTTTYTTVLSRPVELQSGMQMFAANAIKLYEFLVLRGCEEVTSLLMEFVQKVLGRYLKSSIHMTEISKPWAQSREILRMICLQTTNIDVVISLMATLDHIKLKFLSTWSTGDTVPMERDMVFVTYGIAQLVDLINKTNDRILQLQRRESFALKC